MDKLSKEQRRKNMQAVRAVGSKIEMILAKKLFARGCRYRKNDKTVFGKPDLTLKKYKIAIFVDGEFWHGKDWDIRKSDHKTNQAFWHGKIERNMERDKEVNTELAKQGWTVLRFWGKEIKANLMDCILRIEETVNKKRMTPDNGISTVEVTTFAHNDKHRRLNRPKEAGLHKMADNALQYRIFEAADIPFPAAVDPKFTFIDLFAGIGGFRLALQNLGGKCVFTSEWDNDAQKTYSANFGDVPFGDITQESTKSHIPAEFDVLCAGFPCQAFSIAGKRGGFEDTRGTLFFDVAEIIRRKQPKAIFLENVKGLINHNGGKTLATILNVLRNDLNYYIPEPETVNAKDFGVPQNRERLYIVGFRKDLNVTWFNYPKPTGRKVSFADVKEANTVPTKYYLSARYIKTLREHKARHESKGNGFGFEIIPDDGISNAIVVGGMGRERNLVVDNRIVDFTPTTNIKGEVNREGIRKMTPREWARLPGFPDNFVIPVADASAYKQFGNSVAVPAIQATAHEILKLILKHEYYG
jgi:DNA (cytosine-5)-methyltransferase 1